MNTVYVILSGLVLFAGVLFGLWLFHHLYFNVFPQRAIRKYQEADPERLRRYLERVVATPSLFGPGVKLVAHGGLVGVYLPKGQHTEAEWHCRAQLACLSELPDPAEFSSLEADIRRRLGDCLEGLGQVSEAREEFARAAKALKRAPVDPLRYLTEGTLLERANRHDEAYEAFQRAFEVTPESDLQVRIECLVHMTLSAYHSGRPQDCLRWADEAIALGATGRFLRSACKMAGIACGNLSRLDEAADYFRRAYDASVTDNNHSDMTGTLALLADNLRKRGKLKEAWEAARRVEDLNPKDRRTLIAIQSAIQKELGHYDEAMAILAGYGKTDPLSIVHFDQRQMAIGALTKAQTEAARDRGDEAWRQIQEALSVLKDDPKLGLQCDAAAAWIHALRGLVVESQQLASQVETRLAAFESDPSVCRSVYYYLGMAAGARADYDSGVNCWNRYFTLNPDPVYHPTAYYQRAECYRQLGQSVEADRDYRAAVDMNLETHHTKLAQRRLSGFAAP